MSVLIKLRHCNSFSAAEAGVRDYIRYRQDSCTLSDSPIGAPSGTAAHQAASRPDNALIRLAETPARCISIIASSTGDSCLR